MVKFDSGLSGCNVSLVGRDNIKKISISKKYYPRLRKQAIKHKEFNSLDINGIKTPHVKKMLPNGYIMEYIPYQNIHESSIFFDKNKINKISNNLINLIDYEILKSDFYDEGEAFKIVQSKLKDLHKGSDYKSFIKYLMRFNIEYNKIPKSVCHGDLTSTNIIFDGKKVYLIDFLDSYIENYLIDLSKIKQDFFYFWSSLISSKKNKKYYQSHLAIWNPIEYKFKKILNTKSFHFFDAINLLRIEPYLTFNHKKNILSSIVKDLKLFKNYEKLNHTNGW